MSDCEACKERFPIEDDCEGDKDWHSMEGCDGWGCWQHRCEEHHARIAELEKVLRAICDLDYRLGTLTAAGRTLLDKQVREALGDAKHSDPSQ